MDLSLAPSLIEKQFPVSRLSKESYKERKAASGQTLTGLGKWWGRKPLVLVRATILASLLPATADAKKDRELFLRLMRMDDDSIFERQKGTAIVPEKVAPELSAAEQEHWLAKNAKGKWIWNSSRTMAELDEFKRARFAKIALDERLSDALRPEEVDDRPYPDALWIDIESHWGIKATSLDSLVEELGKARFGHRPKVGDCFCGGGSIPFEAARIGCEAFASDLNPVAGLLTWGALNIVGGGPEAKEKVESAQKQWLEAVDAQITAWGIEHNDKGERADAYLYCAETICPNTECGWAVPMSPSWLVSQKTDTGIRLLPDEVNRRYDFAMATGKGISMPTVAGGKLVCPHCKAETRIKTIRGDYVVGAGKDKETKNKLRPWTKEEFKPKASDIFQERLYCVRWVKKVDGSRDVRRYAAPDASDLAREQKVEALLSERFADWQEKGFIPNAPIEPGEETSRLTRERGWTHWHQILNPRQLILLGCFSENLRSLELVTALGKKLDWSCKGSMWLTAQEIPNQIFANQAINPGWNYGARGHLLVGSLFRIKLSKLKTIEKCLIKVQGALQIDSDSDLWITDPPYADAVNYHELTECFLAWYQPHLKKHFPNWPVDSRRALAVKGEGEPFMKTAAAIYANLTKHMPDNGMQVLMFTHQDADVWADLAIIIWAAGLKATAAWVIGTETSSGLKEGNYVQGTVLLVLRKRDSDEEAFRSDVWPSVRREVESQIRFMRGLDAAHGDSPDFSDSDYQLAAYAAALKAITSFAAYNGYTPEDALGGSQKAKESIRKLIDDALHLAGNLLIPIRLHAEEEKRVEIWGKLNKHERFLVQSLESSRSGIRQQGVFQDLAKGFGLSDYKEFFADTKANEIRFKTPSEWGKRRLETGGDGWEGSLCRMVFRAIDEVRKNDNAGQAGLEWLRTEFGADFFQKKEMVVFLLKYFAGVGLDDWAADVEAAGILAETVQLAAF